MESRFGYDFGAVRVHADDRAARWADDLDANAFTSGSSIVFSQNAYDPHSRIGRRLLAHELTHVVQQAYVPGLRDRIQRQPKVKPAAAAVWYQAAIDEVDVDKARFAEQRKNGGFEWSPYWDVKKALLDLCESVDKKDTTAVPKKLDALLKVGLWVHLQLVSRRMLTELSARMYEMGLESDALRLRKAYADAELAMSGRIQWDVYAAQRRIDFVTRLVAGAKRDAKSDTPDAVTASLHRYARVYVPLRDEYLSIDWEGVERERASTSPHGMGPDPGYEGFYLAIQHQIEEWLRGLSTLIQTVMDNARRDLESPTPTGQGAALLKALRTVLFGELSDEMFPKDPKKDISRDVTVPITHTKLAKGTGTIRDEFAEGKEAKARAVAITTYDPEQEFVKELHTSLRGFLKVRFDQLDVLGRVYGLLDLMYPEKDAAKEKEKEEKARDTAETIRRMSGGRFRLDSDDDWRAFLLQRYRDLTNPPTPPAPTSTSGTPAPAPTKKKALPPAEALNEIIELLFTYLKAFTVHARFTNIYDVGPTYLNRPFPRALTGQLVQDCGVYAVRVAYMLSLVRSELGLKFRFVTMPVHVSLVITGDKLPAFIVENDQFTKIDESELDRRRKEWQKFLDPATGKAPAGPADEEQFIGETATREFIGGPLDMPFKVTDVPPPVADVKKTQKQLWDYYEKIGTEDVFGPSSQKKGDPNYLFHKFYLELTEKSRQLHNKYFVPFWNTAAPDAWDKFQGKISASPTPGAAAPTSMIAEELASRVSEYGDEFEDAAKDVKAQWAALDAEKVKISERLRADPKLSKAGVRISVGIRATADWHYHWDSHLRAIRSYENDLLSRPDPAKDKEPLEKVPKELNPPFIPRDEKHAEPLD
jgi:hypothetical protein